MKKIPKKWRNIGLAAFGLTSLYCVFDRLTLKPEVEAFRDIRELLVSGGHQGSREWLDSKNFSERKYEDVHSVSKKRRDLDKDRRNLIMVSYHDKEPFGSDEGEDEYFLHVVKEYPKGDRKVLEVKGVQIRADPPHLKSYSYARYSDSKGGEIYDRSRFESLDHPLSYQGEQRRLIRSTKKELENMKSDGMFSKFLDKFFF